MTFSSITNSATVNDWVGLTEAAKLLGVHPATIRNWADRGLLPSQKTPGGHRRFRRADLMQWQEGQRANPSAEAQLLVRSAVGRARMEIGEGQLSETDWYRQLDDSSRGELRTQGRRLMETFQHYLGSSTDADLAEARLIGLAYGKTLQGQGLRLGQTVEGFFTFNDFLLESTLQLNEMNRINPEQSDSIRKVYTFTREIILALIDSYEQPKATEESMP